jgi:hypothetical protein
MDKNIHLLAERCDGQMTTCEMGCTGFNYIKFADLLLKEAITVMNQEWYELNNRQHPEKESDRDIGFRVGQKSQTLLLMGKIKKHFGVE